MSADLRYTPTRERVELLRLANEGQVRPGDPGRGVRLYAVRFPDGSTGQASLGELTLGGRPATRDELDGLLGTRHTYTVVVEGCTRAQADQVMAERIAHDEDYGFTYEIGFS